MTGDSHIYFRGQRYGLILNKPNFRMDFQKRWLEPNRVMARANRGFGSSQGFGGPWGYGGFIWILRHEVLYS